MTEVNGEGKPGWTESKISIGGVKRVTACNVANTLWKAKTIDPVNDLS